MKQNQKKYQKISAAFLLAFFLGIVISSPAIAQLTSPIQGGCPPNTIQSGERCLVQNPAPQYLVNIPDFPDLLGRVIEIFLAFAGAIALIFLIIGGFQYIGARGNEEATERAKKTVTGAVIGIVIIIMAFAIVTIVNNLIFNGP